MEVVAEKLDLTRLTVVIEVDLSQPKEMMKHLEEDLGILKEVLEKEVEKLKEEDRNKMRKHGNCLFFEKLYFSVETSAVLCTAFKTRRFSYKRSDGISIFVDVSYKQLNFQLQPDVPRINFGVPIVIVGCKV